VGCPVAALILKSPVFLEHPLHVLLFVIILIPAACSTILITFNYQKNSGSQKLRFMAANAYATLLHAANAYATLLHDGTASVLAVIYLS